MLQPALEKRVQKMASDERCGDVSVFKHIHGASVHNLSNCQLLWDAGGCTSTLVNLLSLHGLSGCHGLYK